MAKRHVNLYFLEVQNQYFEMVNCLNELKKLAEKKDISEEEYTKLMPEVELLKSNYLRLAYIMMLLNKPNKKTKEDIDMNNSWYNVLKGASKEAIIKEDADVLADLKNLIKSKKVKIDE